MKALTTADSAKEQNTFHTNIEEEKLLLLSDQPYQREK
jgi:hypothetical protein